MKFTLVLVGVFLFFNFSYAANKAAKFVSEMVNNSSNITVYKKIGSNSYFGLSGQNSIIQCSDVCLNEDSCQSFHMDGGACVFGFSGDVTAFDESGEEVTPDGGQAINAKGMKFWY